MTDFTQEDLDFFAKMKEATDGMDRQEATYLGIHTILATLLNNKQNLSPDQLADIVNAVLDLHKTVSISEFCRALTTPTAESRPYDLVRRGGDQELKKSTLQSGVAYTITKTEPMVKQYAKRLFTLSEMLFSSDDLAKARSLKEGFERNAATAN